MKVTYRGLVKGVAQAPAIAEEDINIMMATNVTGLINMTQAVLAVYKKRPEGGAGDIINIGSIAGREPYAGGSIYCATKAAVRSFSDSLRKELVATRIRVMEIDPGQVETVSAPADFDLTGIIFPKLQIFLHGKNADTFLAYRSFLLFGFMVTRQRRMQSMRKSSEALHKRNSEKD